MADAKETKDTAGDRETPRKAEKAEKGDKADKAEKAPRAAKAPGEARPDLEEQMVSMSALDIVNAIYESAATGRQVLLA